MLIKLGIASITTKARWSVSGTHDGYKTFPQPFTLLRTVGTIYTGPIILG
jgi:hypothetical protein